MLWWVGWICVFDLFTAVCLFDWLVVFWLGWVVVRDAFTLLGVEVLL